MFKLVKLAGTKCSLIKKKISVKFNLKLISVRDIIKAKRILV